MKRLLACLALGGCAGLAAVHAPAAGPLPPGNRFLFVVDISAATKKLDRANCQALFDALFTGLQGQMRPGDTYGIWTFNEKVFTGEFEMRIWDPNATLEQASQAASFLKARRYKGKATFEPVLNRLWAVLRLVNDVNVLVLSDGSTPFQGTAFDASINAAYKARAAEQRAAKKPFITTLIAREGKFMAANVTLAGEYIAVPEPPPPKPVPAQTAANKTPAPAPPAGASPATTDAAVRPASPAPAAGTPATAPTPPKPRPAPIIIKPSTPPASDTATESPSKPLENKTSVAVPPPSVERPSKTGGTGDRPGPAGDPPTGMAKASHPGPDVPSPPASSAPQPAVTPSGSPPGDAPPSAKPRHAIPVTADGEKPHPAPAPAIAPSPSTPGTSSPVAPGGVASGSPSPLPIQQEATEPPPPAASTPAKASPPAQTVTPSHPQPAGPSADASLAPIPLQVILPPPLTVAARERPTQPVAPSAGAPAESSPPVATAAPIANRASDSRVQIVAGCSLLAGAVGLILLVVLRGRSNPEPSIISRSMGRR